MNDRETILGLIERYKTAIHTGAAEDFSPSGRRSTPPPSFPSGGSFPGRRRFTMNLSPG